MPAEAIFPKSLIPSQFEDFGDLTASKFAEVFADIFRNLYISDCRFTEDR